MYECMNVCVYVRIHVMVQYQLNSNHRSDDCFVGAERQAYLSLTNLVMQICTHEESYVYCTLFQDLVGL